MRGNRGGDVFTNSSLSLVVEVGHSWEVKFETFVVGRPSDVEDDISHENSVFGFDCIWGWGNEQVRFNHAFSCIHVDAIKPTFCLAAAMGCECELSVFFSEVCKSCYWELLRQVWV